MMQGSLNKKFSVFFLKEFIKEVVRSTDTYKEELIKREVHQVLSAQKENQIIRKPILIRPQRQIHNLVREKMHANTRKISNLQNETLEEFRTFLNPKKTKFTIPRLVIPEAVLPSTVSNIRPIPNNQELILPKIGVLIQDPLVKTIECVGPSTKIIVTGAMGRKDTSIILSKEEIDGIIKKFAEVTKIPLQEGIYRVVFGRLSLSAIVSEVIGSKFIIKKLSLPPLQIPFPSR